MFVNYITSILLRETRYLSSLARGARCMPLLSRYYFLGGFKFHVWTRAGARELFRRPGIGDRRERAQSNII